MRYTQSDSKFGQWQCRRFRFAVVILRGIMAIDEKAMQFLEEHIPEQATMALKQAYWHTLAS